MIFVYFSKAHFFLERCERFQLRDAGTRFSQVYSKYSGENLGGPQQSRRKLYQALYLVAGFKGLCQFTQD